MIIATKADKHDDGWRIVLYDKTPRSDGQAEAKLTHAEFHDEIDTYYQQRQLERERLYAQLLAGQVSPVGFYLELQGMNVADVAKRVKLRPRVVQRHMTMEGLRTATVEQLRRYARVFDVSIADFFWFGRTEDTVKISLSSRHEGLLQLVDFSTACGTHGERL